MRTTRVVKPLKPGAYEKTFETRFTFDSFGRMLDVTYPDCEREERLLHRGASIRYYQPMIDPVLLQRLRLEVETRLQGADPAHDFGHVLRTVETARRIATVEGADGHTVHLAALLHEWVNFPKGHPDSPRSGEVCAEQVAQLLAREGVDRRLAENVCECIRVHAFSAGLEARSLEAKVLQDADRLDAIGAIGIARCFATCASMGQPFYHPDDPFCERREADDKSWGLDHFYRKLLMIPDGLHTSAARIIGDTRASFLRAFLTQLRNEITQEFDPGPDYGAPEVTHAA